MTRTDLRVLVDSKRFSFVSTNGMEPTFFEDNVVWKLQLRNFLLVVGSVFLFGTVWHTTILRHFQKLAPFTSGSHSYLPGPTSLIFKLITPSLFSFCIWCIPCESMKKNQSPAYKRDDSTHTILSWKGMWNNHKAVGEHHVIKYMKWTFKPRK